MTYRALVVDDDTAAQFIYRQVLTPLGFEVTSASTGLEALDHLRAGAFDLVLLDLLLPLMSGAELLAYIHDTPHLASTRVVIASAHTRYRESVSLGPRDSFLVKPVTPRALREVARQLTASPSS